MLNINDNDKEDLFRILESRSSASSKDDFLSSTDSDYHSNSETSDSPNIKIGCRDSCCNTINVLSKGCKTINVLTKGEEQKNLLINLISQIDNPELKEKYLKKLKKTLIKDENDKKMKAKINLDETLERFNKRKYIYIYMLLFTFRTSILEKLIFQFTRFLFAVFTKVTKFSIIETISFTRFLLIMFLIDTFLLIIKLLGLVKHFFYIFNIYNLYGSYHVSYSLFA